MSDGRSRVPGGGPWSFWNESRRSPGSGGRNGLGTSLARVPDSLPGMLTALRIVHLLSATVWVGGTIALVFVGVPAIRKLEGEARATAMRALGRRWRPLGWSAMGIAILSGLWLTRSARRLPLARRSRPTSTAR